MSRVKGKVRFITRQEKKIRHSVILQRESVLFIGTEFSILYTSTKQHPRVTPTLNLDPLRLYSTRTPAIPAAISSSSLSSSSLSASSREQANCPGSRLMTGKLTNKTKGLATQAQLPAAGAGAPAKPQDPQISSLALSASSLPFSSLTVGDAEVPGPFILGGRGY